MNSDEGTCTDACTNLPDTVQIDAGMQHALAALPEADCSVVISHIRAMASMSSRQRATILTLTDSGA
jgi:hypothetical protein